MKRTNGFLLWMLLCVMLSACAGRLSDTCKLNNHITIDGVDVSEKTVGEARELLGSTACKQFADSSIEFLLPDCAVTLRACELGIGLGIDRSLKAAAALERSGGNRILSSPYTVHENELRQAVNGFAREYSSQPSDAVVSIYKDSAIPVVFTREKSGVSINADGLYNAVMAAVESRELSTVTVPYSSLAPDITLASIQERQQLVAQFTTYFDSESHNHEGRVHNIIKAAGLINGLMLSPGEEFDCNAILGDRTADNGWQEAPGIRNGRYENEYGGGVCQVSSTLFNAVMMADLAITERTPHSWPMGYVDIGRDATISTGGKNFRFLNSTDQPLSIFMYVDREAESLTASLYGRPLSDGMYIVVTSENTGTLESAGEEVMLDETLPYNTKVVMRDARDGKTAVTYKEYYTRDGELLRRVIAYEDTYRAIDGLCYVSTDLYYMQ